MMEMQKAQFVVCLKTDENADLEVRKIYQVLPDEKAATEGYMRIVDESGEDYLYGSIYFSPVELPRATEEAFLRAA